MERPRSGMAYLEEVYRDLRAGKEFPVGKSMLNMFEKQRATNGIIETYTFLDLKVACRYHATQPYISDPNGGVMCAELHGRGCKECKSCHFCRQKDVAYKAQCSGCGSHWCNKCLHSRYAESTHDIGPGRAYPNWLCPLCRKICNCSCVCQRSSRQLVPTGHMAPEAQSLGYPSCSHYLMLVAMTRTPEGRQELQRELAQLLASQDGNELERAVLEAAGHTFVRNVTWRKDSPPEPSNSLRPAAPAPAPPPARLLPRAPPLSRGARLLISVKQQLPVPEATHTQTRLKALGLGLNDDDNDDDDNPLSSAALFSPLSLPSSSPWWNPSPEAPRPMASRRANQPSARAQQALQHRHVTSAAQGAAHHRQRQQHIDMSTDDHRAHGQVGQQQQLHRRIQTGPAAATAAAAGFMSPPSGSLFRLDLPQQYGQDPAPFQQQQQQPALSDTQPPPPPPPLFTSPPAASGSTGQQQQQPQPAQQLSDLQRQQQQPALSGGVSAVVGGGAAAVDTPVPVIDLTLDSNETDEADVGFDSPDQQLQPAQPHQIQNRQLSPTDKFMRPADVDLAGSGQQHAQHVAGQQQAAPPLSPAVSIMSAASAGLNQPLGQTLQTPTDAVGSRNNQQQQQGLRLDVQLGGAVGPRDDHGPVSCDDALGLVGTGSGNPGRTDKGVLQPVRNTAAQPGQPGAAAQPRQAPGPPTHCLLGVQLKINRPAGHDAFGGRLAGTAAGQQPVRREFVNNMDVARAATAQKRSAENVAHVGGRGAADHAGGAKRVCATHRPAAGIAHQAAGRALPSALMEPVQSHQGVPHESARGQSDVASGARAQPQPAPGTHHTDAGKLIDLTDGEDVQEAGQQLARRPQHAQPQEEQTWMAAGGGGGDDASLDQMDIGNDRNQSMHVHSGRAGISVRSGSARGLVDAAGAGTADTGQQQQGSRSLNAAGQEQGEQADEGSLMPFWWDEELEGCCQMEGFFPQLLDTASMAVARCQSMQTDDDAPQEAKVLAAAHLQRALDLGVWQVLQDARLDLPEALHWNGNQGDSYVGWFFMRDAAQLKCAAALLPLLLEQTTDEEMVHGVVQLALGPEALIRFELCDPGSRAVLARYGVLLVGVLIRRQLLRYLPLAVQGVAAWLTCLAGDHTACEVLLATGWSPHQALVIGAVKELPACTSAMDVHSTDRPLSSACLPAFDDRLTEIQSIGSSVEELLGRILINCQELSDQVGPASRALLGPGLMCLLNPRERVSLALRQRALQTVALIINACQMQLTPALPDGVSSDEQLASASELAELLVKQVVQLLELLLSCIYPSRCRHDASSPPASQPGGQASQLSHPAAGLPVAQFLPRQQDVQVVLLEAGSKNLMPDQRAKLAGDLKAVLSLVYGALMWAGRLQWPTLMQLLLAQASAGGGQLYAQQDSGLRQLALTMLERVVRCLYVSPPLRGSASGAMSLLPLCVQRIWMLSLVDPVCRVEVARLSAALAATPEGLQLFHKASLAIASNPALAAAIRPLPGSPHLPSHTSPALSASEAEGVGGSGAYSSQALQCIWGRKLLAADQLGVVRGAGLAVLMLGAQLSEAAMMDLLGDINKVWDLPPGDLKPEVALTCRAARLHVTLRAVHVAATCFPHQLRTAAASGPAAWRPAGRGAALGGGAAGRSHVVAMMLHRCCVEVVDCLQAVWEEQATRTGLGGQAGDGLVMSVLSNLHACVRLLASAVRADPAAASNRDLTMTRLVFQLLRPAINLPRNNDLQVSINPTSSTNQSPAQRRCNLLLKCVAAACIDALQPGGNAAQEAGRPAGAGGVQEGDAVWAAVQWIVAAPVAQLVQRACKPGNRIGRQEEQACAALQLMRVLLADPRLQSVNAWRWLLPPLMTTTNTLLAQSDFCSPAVFSQVYRLWRDLVPVLAHHGLLKLPSERGGAACMNTPSWTGALPVSQLTNAVSLTYQGLACYVFTCAREVARPGPLPPDVNRQDWQAKTIQESCLGLTTILGYPVALTGDDLPLLDPQLAGRSLPSAAPNTVISAPGDRHWLMLDVQLAFARALACSGQQTGGYLWAARVLPCLYSMLRLSSSTLPDRTIRLFDELVDQERQQRTQAGAGGDAAQRVSWHRLKLAPAEPLPPQPAAPARQAQPQVVAAPGPATAARSVAAPARQQQRVQGLGSQTVEQAAPQTQGALSVPKVLEQQAGWQGTLYSLLKSWTQVHHPSHRHPTLQLVLFQPDKASNGKLVARTIKLFLVGAVAERTKAQLPDPSILPDWNTPGLPEPTAEQMYVVISRDVQLNRPAGDKGYLSATDASVILVRAGISPKLTACGLSFVQHMHRVANRAGSHAAPQPSSSEQSVRQGSSRRAVTSSLAVKQEQVQVIKVEKVEVEDEQEVGLVGTGLDGALYGTQHVGTAGTTQAYMQAG